MSQQCEQLAQFLATTNGRDKMFRAVQYLARALRGAELTPPTLAARVHALETMLSTSRQTFRLLKWVNVAAKQLKPSAEKPPVVDIIDALADLSISAFFLFDNLCWLAKVKVLSLSPNALMQTAARFWVANTLFNALSQLITIALQYVAYLRLKAQLKSALASSSEKRADIRAELRKIQQQQLTRVIETVRALCDMPVAWSLSQSTKHQLSPVLTGVLGTLSSLIGMYQLWPARLKSM